MAHPKSNARRVDAAANRASDQRRRRLAGLRWPRRSRSRARRTARFTIGASAGTAGALLLGYFLSNLFGFGFTQVDHAIHDSPPTPAPTVQAPPRCPDSPKYFSEDRGVGSGIIVASRPSTNYGCFTALPVDLLDGQDFSGFVEWKNRSTKQQDDVSVRLQLPDGVTLVPNTSVFVTSRNPKGVRISDHLADTGVNVGSYSPGGNFYIQYALHFSAPQSMRCGTNTFAITASRIASDVDGSQLTETSPLRYHLGC